MDHRLHISQDPNSKHLGTTVWDASMVFVKFLEKNSRKGGFCPSKLKGKRVIEELVAVLLGLEWPCWVVMLSQLTKGLFVFDCKLLIGACLCTTETNTPQVEVLPLLMRNVERNKLWILRSNSDSGLLSSITVAELDRGNKNHIKAVEPQFDYIIGTDVLGYEIRSTTVHEKMMEMWKSNFIVKTISKSKMDAKYQHPSIHLYMMDPKAMSATEAGVSDNGNDGDDEDVSNPGEDGDHGVKNESCSGFEECKSGNLDDWEIRRCGAMAARLLKDLKV